MDRWEAIRPILAEIPEPFSLLDLGAAEGWFSLRAKQEFDCRVTAIEPRLAKSTLRAHAQLDRIIPLKASAADLRALPRHDVVLALSVLHHCPDWRAVLEQVRACRYWALIEIPDPIEAEWMKMAAARDQLVQIREAVEAVSIATLGYFERKGRDGATYKRSLHLVPGTVQRMVGVAFSGSGSNARSLVKAGDARLNRSLGYQPYPGSLNLRMESQPHLGEPTVSWKGGSGRDRRGYEAWPAWFGGIAGHVIIPTVKKAHPHTLEGWAWTSLRAELAIEDGDQVLVDVEPTRAWDQVHNGAYRMWRLRGKIGQSLALGMPYEASLLYHVQMCGFEGLAVDVGANIGNHTLWFREICGLNVAAFEPVKHQELERNVRLNSHGARSKPWIMTFTYALGSSPNLGRHISKGRLEVGRGQIPVTTLDTPLVSVPGLRREPVALLKIDVEGMEPDVILGARETLRKHRPVVFVEENDRAAIEQALNAALPYERTAHFGKSTVTPVGKWEPVK